VGGGGGGRCSCVDSHIHDDSHHSPSISMIITYCTHHPLTHALNPPHSVSANQQPPTRAHSTFAPSLPHNHLWPPPGTRRAPRQRRGTLAAQQQRLFISTRQRPTFEAFSWTALRTRIPCDATTSETHLPCGASPPPPTPPSHAHTQMMYSDVYFQLIDVKLDNLALKCLLHVVTVWLSLTCPLASPPTQVCRPEA
jgi:hypothetical protein